jgi:hypothetical protein
MRLQVSTTNFGRILIKQEKVSCVISRFTHLYAAADMWPGCEASGTQT